jgi:23S rRNA (pseudouridine1915-N3)-methyltransferase
MLKLRILSVGKTKEKWLEEAFNEYQKRLKPILHIECLWAKDSQQLLEWAQKETCLIGLDPSGRLLNSEQFANFVDKCWNQGGSRFTFVIGGAEGLPVDIKQKSILISLSPLTFTHQITRLVLIEQIYRSTEILKNSQYHK